MELSCINLEIKSSAFTLLRHFGLNRLAVKIAYRHLGLLFSRLKVVMHFSRFLILAKLEVVEPQFSVAIFISVFVFCSFLVCFSTFMPD